MCMIKALMALCMLFGAKPLIAVRALEIFLIQMDNFDVAVSASFLDKHLAAKSTSMRLCIGMNVFMCFQ